MELSESQKLATNPLMAGLLGAAIGLKFVPGLRWFERVTNFTAGLACSVYVSPAAGELLKLSSAPKQAALTFLMGLFSVSIAAAIFEGIRNVKLAEIIDGYLRRRSDKP